LPGGRGVVASLGAPGRSSRGLHGFSRGFMYPCVRAGRRCLGVLLWGLNSLVCTGRASWGVGGVVRAGGVGGSGCRCFSSTCALGSPAGGGCGRGCGCARCVSRARCARGGCVGAVALSRGVCCGFRGVLGGVGGNPCWLWFVPGCVCCGCGGSWGLS